MTPIATVIRGEYSEVRAGDKKEISLENRQTLVLEGKTSGGKVTLKPNNPTIDFTIVVPLRPEQEVTLLSLNEEIKLKGIR